MPFVTFTGCEQDGTEFSFVVNTEKIIFAEPLSGLDKLGTRIYFTELFYKDVNETISEVHEALLRA